MSRCCVWDITINAQWYTEDELCKLFNEYCKKWCFQKEKGEKTGYIHYQCRVSLKTKKSMKQVSEIIRGHLSPTSNKNRDNTFYVEKTETSIGEVYSDKTYNPVYIPRQIREITQLRPFQQQIIDLSKVWDTRKINIIYDDKGNLGKSVLVNYMRCHKLGRKLPFSNDFRDLMRMVCDTPISNCYLIDFPRSINNDKLYQLFQGIEEIKNGYAYDDRYKFKETFFDCPNIFVFSNQIFPSHMLSIDRWRYYKIDDEYNLVEYNPYEENNIE